MRSLNECRDEIFRRSEERIAKRRRIRNFIFASGAALCLTVAICSVVIGSSIYNKGNLNLQSGAVPSAESKSQFSIVMVEIQNNKDSLKGYRSIADKNEAASIYSAILDLYHENAVVKSEDVDGDNISIKFTAENGQKEIYILQGNKLYGINSKSMIYLTDNQLENLKRIIGLTNQ